MTDSLPTYEPSDCFPHVDNVHIKSMYTIVDTIDGRIDPTCKINLSPPSKAFVLNGSTLS